MLKLPIKCYMNSYMFADQFQTNTVALLAGTVLSM